MAQAGGAGRLGKMLRGGEIPPEEVGPAALGVQQEESGIHAPQRVFERAGLERVPRRHLHLVHPRPPGQPLPVAGQDAHAVSGFQQPRGQPAADVAGDAGDQDARRLIGGPHRAFRKFFLDFRPIRIGGNILPLDAAVPVDAGLFRAAPCRWRNPARTLPRR